MAGAGPDIAAAKRELREAALAAREAMTAADRRRAGAALARHGVEMWARVGRVAAYLSFGAEPPTGPLLDALATGGTLVVVPVVAGDDLDWVSYQPGCETVTGALGVAEPTGARLGAATLSTVELVLVPALAVDRAGHRLGRGRGYYDRALASVTAPVVAVGYDDELVDHVPSRPHDRRVDAVLRPAGYLPL